MTSVKGLSATCKLHALPYSKSMKKCEGVVLKRKLFGTEELSLGDTTGDFSPNFGKPGLRIPGFAAVVAFPRLPASIFLLQ